MTIVPKVAASPPSKELKIAMWLGIISPAARTRFADHPRIVLGSTMTLRQEKAQGGFSPTRITGGRGAARRLINTFTAVRLKLE